MIGKSKLHHPNQIINYEELYEISLKFDRSNATYKPDEVVSGSVSLASKNDQNFKLDVSSVNLNIQGNLVIQNRQNKPQIDEIIKKVVPINFISIKDMVLASDKTINPETKLPFRFKLQKAEHKYLESYIGVYISISYSILVQFRFSEKRIIQQQIPFFVQVPRAGRQTIENFIYPKKKNFIVVSQDIKGDKAKIPNFKIRGQLETEICYFSQDLNGSIIVDIADSPIRSIDLQMLRVEKIETQAKVFSEKTEIQMIQICDGNVTRNLQIPLYMILPRYYSSPSVKYLWCNVNFEVNLQIIFKDGYKVTVNIPIKLIRS